MVFFFDTCDPSLKIYMGKDKHENEFLIKWGFEEDIWFHVNSLSSAHVYLRMNRGQTIDDIPDDVLQECAQLVKENSIEGCKKAEVKICYTRWRNLSKRADMDIGTIGFADEKEVKYMTIKKDKEIVKRVEKTREWRDVDFEGERQAYDKETIRLSREEKKRQEAEEKRIKEERQRERELKSYDNIMKEDEMKTNDFGDNVDFRAVEDDFM